MTARTRAMPVRGTAGFTVLEVTATLVLFGIVAAGLAANTIAVVRNNRNSKNLSVATTLAQDQIEQLLALDPETNPSALAAGAHTDTSGQSSGWGGSSGNKFTRQWTVTRDSPAPGLSTVAVSVSWTDGSTRAVRLTTYVCQTSTCS
jgi:type II secretory pathway pseudopilin PulG